MPASRLLGSCLSTCLTAVGLVGFGLATAPAAEAAVSPGTPYTWGANSFGQLGNGSKTPRTTPAPVPSLSGVTDLHSGREHVIVLMSNQTVRTWGSNQMGQLGLGGGPERTTPTPVPGLSGIVSVTTGHYHSMALTADGRIWAWGRNVDGQLGDGSRTNRASPVLVSGIDDAIAIAAGRDMSYAIRAGGTVWAWGLNKDGQLGDGTTTNRTTPVRVGTLTGVVGVSGGRDHGLAVRGDGTVWAWGWNVYGQVGDGTLVNKLTPVQVSTGAVAVAGGAHHSFALKADGTVQSWGRNYRAELGDGTGTNRTRPVQVLNVADAVAIGSGRDHGIAILADGTVRAWGSNENGELGDGTTTNRNRAVVVPGITGATIASGGEGHSVVLVSDGPPQNRAPTARFSSNCGAMACTFDGSTSSDPDGDALSYAWDFGDGESSTQQSPAHPYSDADTYDVHLTVTDPGGLSHTVTHQVVVGDPPPATVVFRAAASTNANALKPFVTIPAAVQTGDALVLIASTNRNATLATPAGWTLLGTRLDAPDLKTWAYTRAAPAGAAGTKVTASLDAISKTSLTLLAYSGAGTVQASASAAETGTSASHQSPSVPVAVAGSRVVSYWADKTAGHAAWTLPAAVTPRNANAGTGAGTVIAASGDSGPVPAGTWSGLAATSGVSSAKAVSWSIVIPPA